ncbi:MAG TPA: DHA2 family efflux MFS transporter permease subunit [Casimicrobiaceae bacterium]|nr:DHA2 family efflux MFS transporter permease subunit [Casimicrobiaceae bacterium]
MTSLQRLTLAATGLGLFMIFLDALIVNVGLPAIQEDFRVGEAGMQWVVAGYSLGMAVFIMSSATLADLFGRRRAYLAGIAVFTLASIACGLAPSIIALDVARGLQGAAAATVNVTSLALVSAAFPEPATKARAIGLWAAIAGVANAIGPTLGGFLIEAIGWRSIFWVNVPVGVVVVLLTVRHVEESRDERSRSFDAVGQALFMVAVGAFAYAVIEGPHEGWTSAPILGFFAVAIAALVAFIRYEMRAPDPMMDLTLFRDRVYALAIATICVALFTFYGMLLLTTQYLQNVRGFTPVDTGLFLLPFAIAMLVASPLAGRMVGKHGTAVPIRIGLSIMMIALVVLIAGTARHPLLVTSGLAMAGFGYALCLTPITTLAMTSVAPARAGMASGIMSAQRAIGSTLGFAVMGSILSAWLGATLDADLAPVIADPRERAVVSQAIIAGANPRAQVAEVAPAWPIRHPDAQVYAAILDVAQRDFVTGIRVALGVAIALLAAVFAAGLAWLPRAPGAALAEAQREAAKERDP